ncbi:MAG: patatin-like phospholipase family protein [Edaphobacter sp.]|uniref:patatin-like phospholipase family protein n=1 Tax=Edaphobacter sp. TaxID=1934404 RepID=UPI0023980E99|nr:patatin-like phospholipase family protein [Edaphobacter sp.]MDE1177881.1 patatin-like phospholipase family protein [Edaphobacter sp.]
MPGFLHHSRVFLIAILAGSIAVDSGAQQPAPSEPQTEQTTTVASPERVPPPPTAIGRKKIGLVLEGGGALGLAHIGVIRWMEQHHIPVDYVAGTSMGGLVGGLYASGMSPDEIDQFVERVDWDRVLSGQVPFSALSYRRKEDKLAFPNRMEFGLKKGLSLPGGLNSGAAVNLLFDSTMLPYWDLHTFDDLPIPFRCVATELNTGQAHVFEDGPLPRALRSTMSIPGVFSPVRVGNDLYSDGAAVDNLPVDVAKSMGAQVIISSYLNTGPPAANSMSSPIGIAGRNVSIMVAANEVNSLKNSDVVVSSDVSKFGALEFSKSNDIIPVGEKAADLQAAALEKYALNDHDWAVYLAQRQARRRKLIPIPQFVEVSGLHGSQQKDVDSKFEKYVGKPVDTVQIEKSIADLQGTWLYSTINYNIVDRKGKPGLLIRPLTKDYGPPFMNFGLTILTNDSNDVQLGVGFRATFFNLVGPGSEVRLDGNVGQPAGGRAELFKPLWPGAHLFAAPHIYAAHQTTPYFQGSSQLDEFKERRNGIGLDLGYLFNSRTELRVGEDVQWFSETQTIGTPSGSEFSIVPYVTKVRFQYLGQDDMMVPTKGTVMLTTYNYYTARPFNQPGGYSQLTGKMEHFFKLDAKANVFATLQGGTSFNTGNLGLAGLAAGGPLQLSAYAKNELLGTDYFIAQGGYYRKMLQLNPVIADGVYLGASYEIGKMFGGNAETPSLPNDVTGFVVVKTLLGPVFAGVSIGDSDHRKWYFGLGRVF